MGCKQLQLNNFFQFAEPEEINRNNFRFVESKEQQAPCTSVPRNRAFKIFKLEDFIGDDILSQSSTPNSPLSTSYLLYDGHGSTRLLTSDTGSISARYNYDAYGKNLFSANATTPSATDMLYSGEQFDPNLQMQYLRARYYEQNNGRFNRLDPFSGNNYDPQSLHKYAYTHCNTVSGIDPSGEMTLLLTVSVIVAIVAISLFIVASIITVITTPDKISYFIIKSKNFQLTFTPTSVEDFYNNLESFANQHGEIIYLSFYGHGINGGLSIGTPSILIEANQLWENTPLGEINIPIIQNSFSDDALVELFACYSNSPNGWGKKLSEILPNAQIYGFTGPTRSLWPFHWTWVRNFGFPHGGTDSFFSKSSWQKIQ